MRRTILNAFGCIVTLSIIIGGIHTLGYIVRPTDTDGAYSQVETFHRLPKNSVEVIIYGSSHAYRGLDTRELYNAYGIGAYNYSWHWQNINTTKTFLLDSLRTQSPKLILIETFHAGQILTNVNITPEIYYSKYLYDKKSVRKYLRQCFIRDKRRYLSYYMPLYAFHENWSALTKNSFTPLIYNDYLLTTMGFAPSDRVEQVTLPDSSMLKQQEFSEEAITELDEIIAICRKRNIDILFFTTPYQDGYVYGNAMARYAKENNCPYFNLFDYVNEVGLDNKTDYSDTGHLNTSGSIKVADFLGQYITKHYELTDMRIIENNLWEQNIVND